MTIAEQFARACIAVILMCGLACMWAASMPVPEAAEPSFALQPGQTYEVIWGCLGGSCSIELLTVARVDKKGWAQDTKGYWFKPESAIAIRVAVKAPDGGPHPIVPTERVQR